MKLAMILVDAFAYDYLSEKYTPFLYNLSNTDDATLLKLSPILGYSDSIRATIFTGVYPEHHNYWMFYKFSPDTSPFRSIKKLRCIENFPEMIKKPAKMFISMTYCKYISKKYGYKNLSIQNFPLNVVDHFDFTLKCDMLNSHAFGKYKTIFEILNDHAIKWHYINSGVLTYLFRYPLSQKKYLADKINNIYRDVNFLFIYLHHLDMLAHRFGVKSKKFQKILMEMDKLIEFIYGKLKKMGYNVVIFSDHGMADAQKFINFNYLIKNDGFGKDYLVALDSTMIRIWYLKENGYKIKELLENLNYGKFLSKNDIKQLKINFKHRWYFDDIYLIDPPYNIYPNYTSLLKPYAMHAYHPDLTSQKGIVIFDSDINLKNVDDVELVDFFPTLLDYFGIYKNKINPLVGGVSLLRKK